MSAMMVSLMWVRWLTWVTVKPASPRACARASPMLTAPPLHTPRSPAVRGHGSAIATMSAAGRPLRLSGLARKFVGGAVHAARGVGLGLVVGVDAVKQVVEVGAGEVPAERPGDGVVAGFERGEAVADLAEVGEVVGCEGVALEDGEVDLGLVQPGCVGGQVDQVRVRPGFAHPGD